MKKNIALLSVLLLVSTHVQSVDDRTPVHAPYFSLNKLQNWAVGGGIGYSVGLGLNHLGAQKVLNLPGVRHILRMATEEERAILQNHLPELCALVGAFVAEGSVQSLLKLTKIAALVDAVQRIRAGNYTPESLAYLVRDLVWTFEEHAPEHLRRRVGLHHITLQR